MEGARVIKPRPPHLPARDKLVEVDEQRVGDNPPRPLVTDSSNELAVLSMALEHVDRWMGARTTSGLQVLNFFLIAVALLTNAYVSAINGRLHLIASAVALVGAAVSSGAYLVGRRQRDVARLGEKPIAELQDRLASQLGIDSLRMTASAVDQRKTWWRSSTVMANAIFALAAVLGVAASVYAWYAR